MAPLRPRTAALPSPSARLNIVGSPAIVGASEFSAAGEGGGYRGDLHGYAYAELSRNPSARDFSALGGLPHNTPLLITFRGRSVIAYKRDIGAGGGDVAGHHRSIDLFGPTARALGFNGLGVVTIQRLSGHPKEGPIAGGVTAVNTRAAKGGGGIGSDILHAAEAVPVLGGAVSGAAGVVGEVGGLVGAVGGAAGAVSTVEDAVKAIAQLVAVILEPSKWGELLADTLAWTLRLLAQALWRWVIQPPWHATQNAVAYYWEVNMSDGNKALVTIAFWATGYAILFAKADDPPELLASAGQTPLGRTIRSGQNAIHRAKLQSPKSVQKHTKSKPNPHTSRVGVDTMREISVSRRRPVTVRERLQGEVSDTADTLIDKAANARHRRSERAHRADHGPHSPHGTRPPQESSPPRQAPGASEHGKAGMDSQNDRGGDSQGTTDQSAVRNGDQSRGGKLA